MTFELQKYFKTGFKVYKIGTLVNGDVIQYKSKDKYYRYLQFVENNGTNVELKGAYNTPISIKISDFNKSTAEIKAH